LTDESADDIAAEAVNLIAQEGGYSGDGGKMDRYRDFRMLFSSDVGQKVLAEIHRMAFAGRSVAASAGFDPHKTMYLDGMRNLALQIHITATREPKALPQRAVSKSPLRKG